MNHYDVRSIYTERAGRSLARSFDKRVLRTLVLAARTTTPTITGGPAGETITKANLDTDAGALKDAIAEAAEAMDSKNVPTDERYVVLRPKAYYTLLKDREILNRDYGQAGSLATATLPEWMNFKLLKSNNMPTGTVSAVSGERNNYAGDFTNTVGVAFQKCAVGTVKLLDLAVEAEYSVRHQATLIVAKYAMGHGCLYPEAAVELAKSAGGGS